MKNAKYTWELDQTVGCRENPGYTMRGNELCRAEVCTQLPGVTRLTIAGRCKVYIRGGHLHGTLRSALAK